MAITRRLFLLVVFASLLIVQPATSAPSAAPALVGPAQPPAPTELTAPASLAPTNALLDAVRQGKWPAQVAASSGAIRPDRHGPQRTDPAEAFPRTRIRLSTSAATASTRARPAAASS